MTFVGVDQSLNATGLCVLDENGSLLSLQSIEHKVGGDIDKKLLNIRRVVISVLSGARFATLEAYSYDSIHRAFDLGAVAGTVRVAFVEHEIPYAAVAPTTLKLFATGTGTARKDDMIAAARAQGVTPADDNQADAYFLARVARAMLLGSDRKRCEMEAIHSIQLSVSGKQDKRRNRAPRRFVKNAL